MNHRVDQTSRPGLTHPGGSNQPVWFDPGVGSTQQEVGQTTGRAAVVQTTLVYWSNPRYGVQVPTCNGGDPPTAQLSPACSIHPTPVKLCRRVKPVATGDNLASPIAKRNDQRVAEKRMGVLNLEREVSGSRASLRAGQQRGARQVASRARARRSHRASVIARARRAGRAPRAMQRAGGSRDRHTSGRGDRPVCARTPARTRRGSKPGG